MVIHHSSLLGTQRSFWSVLTETIDVLIEKLGGSSVSRSLSFGILEAPIAPFIPPFRSHHLENQVGAFNPVENMIVKIGSFPHGSGWK